MRRVVSIWLIDWPVTVHGKTSREPPPEAAPFALVEKGAHGVTLRALNPAARAQGLRRGQSHADARAICPALISRPAEPEREAQALARLARWCERWSPLVAIDASPEGMEGLFVDMTAGAHLFGGEAALLADMRTRLAKAAIPARLAIADTPGAAWAMARFGKGGIILPPGEARAALADLPIAALRIDGETERLARRFGLKRIGDLYPLPRAKLARRFQGGDALGLVRRLDQALGAEPEPLVPLRPLPDHHARAIFAEPLADPGGVEGRLEELMAALAAGLEEAALGALALRLTGFRSDGGVTALAVRLGRPSRDIAIWRRLFREKGLGQLDLGFGIDALTLSADRAAPLHARQSGLDGAEGAAEERLSDLVDRLSARLGAEAVLRGEPVASWIPERSEQWRVAQAQSRSSRAKSRDVALRVSTSLDTNGSGSRGLSHASRPILLLDPPEPIETTAEIPDGAPARFKWRRVSRKVVRAQGPERIAPRWWRGGKARTRDYYRVEDEDGVRYWLFREGLFGRDDPARPPSWWMHGLFP
jgi:protein ImuB